MVFDLTILGCSSATPTSKRSPTSQLLNILDRHFLIDCGEGTQVQMRKFKIKFARINHIFISHLHGDHFFGLVGFLSSLHLLGRTNDMNIYCPPGLKDILELQFKHSDTRLRYTINYTELEYGKSVKIFEDNKLEIFTIPLLHRISCNGFLFKEKPSLPGIKKEAIRTYNISVEQLPKIKQGQDLVLEDGRVIPNKELTVQPPPPRAYAYCSDTAYNEQIIPIIEGVDLLYHEATFMEDMKPRAVETFHSTTIDAATIAKKAGVKQLIIGHYSARYSVLEPMQAEAQSVFPNTLLAEEGRCYKVLQTRE
jgi:ribonuclease Z